MGTFLKMKPFEVLKLFENLSGLGPNETFFIQTDSLRYTSNKTGPFADKK